MVNFNNFYQLILKNTLLSHLIETIPSEINNIKYKDNNIKNYSKIIKKIPNIVPENVDLINNVSAYNKKINVKKILIIEKLLKKLNPWRKGPFFIYNINIESEWRSDWKWNRIKPYISSLQNKSVLDVGCNNGYYMWRMIGCGASFVIGIDPNQLFLYQFEAIKKLLSNNQKIHLLPLKLEQLPKTNAFDTVFSMGVLYHQRSPFDHILNLKKQLVKNGELILETLVIKGNEKNVLVPETSYAKMNNIWFIPSYLALKKWIKKCGFKNVRIVNYSRTSTEEQKSTSWTNKRSLSKFLNPNNDQKTLEGYPSPFRAVIIANNS